MNETGTTLPAMEADLRDQILKRLQSDSSLSIGVLVGFIALVCLVIRYLKSGLSQTWSLVAIGLLCAVAALAVSVLTTRDNRKSVAKLSAEELWDRLKRLLNDGQVRTKRGLWVLALGLAIAYVLCADFGNTKMVAWLAHASETAYQASAGEDRLNENDRRVLFDTYAVCVVDATKMNVYTTYDLVRYELGLGSAEQIKTVWTPADKEACAAPLVHAGLQGSR